MKKLLVVATLILLGSTSAANALTIDLGDANQTFGYSPGGTYTSNVDLSNLSAAPPVTTLDFNHNSFLVSGSVNSNYTQPVGTIGEYLAVKGTGNPGTATFNLGGGMNEFAFAWGTIDSYNNLLITDSNGHTFNFSGSDILAQIGNPPSGGSQTNVFFQDPFGNIVSAVLTSSRNAFEAANFFEAHANLPLPASLPLFGGALVALMMLARRSRTARN